MRLTRASGSQSESIVNLRSHLSFLEQAKRTVELVLIEENSLVDMVD